MTFDLVPPGWWCQWSRASWCCYHPSRWCGGVWRTCSSRRSSAAWGGAWPLFRWPPPSADPSAEWDNAIGRCLQWNTRPLYKVERKVLKSAVLSTWDFHPGDRRVPRGTKSKRNIKRENPARADCYGCSVVISTKPFSNIHRVVFVA